MKNKLKQLILEQSEKLLEMADQVVPKIYDTTPEGGREALLDVLAMINETGDWTQRISPEERELYEKLSEFLSDRRKNFHRPATAPGKTGL